MGATLSVLWAVVGPAWLVVENNTWASDDAEQLQELCLALARTVSESYDDATKRAQVYDKMVAECASAKVTGHKNAPPKEPPK